MDARGQAGVTRTGESEQVMELDKSNVQQVEKQGEHVVILNPRSRMTVAEAVALAYWLVTSVDDKPLVGAIMEQMGQ